MSGYKFSLGQQVVDIECREGYVYQRFTGLSGACYLIRYEDSAIRELTEDSLFSIDLAGITPKYAIGDLVFHKIYGVGTVVSFTKHFPAEVRYSIKFDDGGWTPKSDVNEQSVTKIDHDIRPGDWVTFNGWAELCGTYTVRGEVIKLRGINGIDLRCDKTKGIYSKSVRHVTKIDKPVVTKIQYGFDLPLPPKLDTLKSMTWTTTIENPSPELVKLLTGSDVISCGKVTVPTPRIAAARRELDRQIKDAEAELTKLKEARGKL